MIAKTTTRVPEHTPIYLNERIRHKTKDNIARYGKGAATIGERLEQLDHEWDIERTLEANASILVVFGTLLGVLVSPWFYVVPFLVGFFLLQHAIQGWCPPLRLFRRMGFRTHAEIASEYYALRSMRGDFGHLHVTSDKTASPTAEDAYVLFRWVGQEDPNLRRKSCTVVEARRWHADK
jgi:hypothetical protein